MSIDPRIHECLDGNRCRQDLSGPEQAELTELERDLASVAEYVRSVPTVDLRMAVLQSLPETVPARGRRAHVSAALHRAWNWIWTPRPLTIRLRPAWALATAVLVSLVAHQVFPSSEVEEPQRAAAAEARSVYVQFRLDAAEASSVALAGSFSGWSPAIELQESAPGVWTAMVPLTPGVHDYLFLIDGAEWVPDPAARPVEDDFGGTNSRLFLTLPSSQL